MKAAVRRSLVAWVRLGFGYSERQACGLMGICRPSLRYKHRRDPQIPLRMRLKELAAARVRFGYRRLTVLLRREGWMVNAKRVYRIYKEEGLMIRTKLRKKIARRRPLVVESAKAPNQRWSMDFVAARLEDVWKPTRLAVLLFAEFPSELLGEKYAIRLFHYQGDTIKHVGATTNLVKPPRTIGGPAVRQIRDALKAVEEELASGVQVSPMGFEMIQRYPRRAIQEAITNAVIHRDYSIPLDIQIRIFSDRIEVESPGGLPHRLKVQDLGLVRSMPRNPSLVNHLREFPAPPNQDAGEGIPMMKALMRQADLYPPLFLLPKGAEWESVEVALLNESRPSAWDQVSDYLDKRGDLGNAEVREILQTKDTLGVSKMLKAWVETRLLEVVDLAAAKQNRRYRKPGPQSESDLFSWLRGNEPQPDDQPDGF